MHFEPSTRRLVLNEADLADERLSVGWALALADGVAITSATRHGATSAVYELPMDLGEAYFPDVMVRAAIQQSRIEVDGDPEHAWGGWAPLLEDDENEW